MLIRKQFIITGQVQGVGFRPATYKLAKKLKLTGRIYNHAQGVTLQAQGSPEALKNLEAVLKNGAVLPPLAKIKTIKILEIPALKDEAAFTIDPSDQAGQKTSQVLPDTSVCADCLAEMYQPKDFRYLYPFINCTNCGPRYSIIKTIPYDRANTTMADFRMCQKCSKQYNNPSDRRFHAQPVACTNCGPKITLTDKTGKIIQSQSDKVVSTAAKMLKAGKILAVKGIGGFHLAVDASNETAVRQLRLRKKRDHKPFALMARSLKAIRKYAQTTEKTEELLTSPQSPIVLLPKKPKAQIAPSTAPGVGTFGFMLCYAPLHFLLFDYGPEVLVMTSANISDQPLICKNDEALEKLADIADAFVMHNREIFRQVDDSIVHIIADHTALRRRSRGYVPEPIFTQIAAPKHILATGADMKNTFCLAKNNQLILSEHIGDLEDAEVYRHYLASIAHLAGLFEIEPQVIACDLHPAYISTNYALSLKNMEIMRIQHHWAHIASVLAEHNHPSPVIGIECDGTGYGTDGAVWGCELMTADLADFQRIGHLAYYDLPGGDTASKEAIRPAIALLFQAFGDDFNPLDFADILEPIESDTKKHQIILKQLQNGINTVKTSSLGRVFDAVAAIVGLGSQNNFEAQLPIALEAIAAEDIRDCYDFQITADSLLLDLRPAIRQIIHDKRNGLEVSDISAKFHNCLATALAQWAHTAAKRTGLKDIAISGGVFCNRYLTNRLVTALQNKGLNVLLNLQAPANDSGIALGQAAIAAHRLTL